MNMQTLRINPRACVSRLLEAYGPEEYQRLTGEELARIESAIKGSGVEFAVDRYHAHRIRNVMSYLLRLF